jgi:hypothetical protein
MRHKACLPNYLQKIRNKSKLTYLVSVRHVHAYTYVVELSIKYLGLLGLLILLLNLQMELVYTSRATRNCFLENVISGWGHISSGPTFHPSSLYSTTVRLFVWLYHHILRSCQETLGPIWSSPSIDMVSAYQSLGPKELTRQTCVRFGH